MNNLEKRKKIEELILNLRDLIGEGLSEGEDRKIGIFFNFKNYSEIKKGKVDVSNIDYLMTLGAILSKSANFRNVVNLKNGDVALLTYKKYEDIIFEILKLILGDENVDLIRGK